MGNGFVSYLNSMNNASGDNINALAEAQVNNKYYKNIKVDRKLGKFIVNKINSGEKNTFIISGYAGDGKTSILSQILNELGMLKDNEKLEINDIKNKDDISLMYVKDMSELKLEEQEHLLKESLKAPNDNKTAILISNTGPLIKTFSRVFGKNEEKKDEIEDVLLQQLDENKLEKINVDGNEFYLINIARVDNIGFVSEVIEKICKDDLWEKCDKCENLNKCHICFNKQCIISNKERVIEFVEKYYRWLRENDKRITIRQMISQLSFSITGNLNCEDIKKFDDKGFCKFNYNFANLFFGYRGIGKIEEANQIKAIELLQESSLDDFSLEQDYDIFVKNNFNYFSDDIKEVLEDIWSKFSRKFYFSQLNDEDNFINKQQELRKSIRRFFLVYGILESIEEKDKLYSQIYGPMFVKYEKLISKKASKSDLNNLNKIIFSALYMKNIGVLPKENMLYLTLTKSENVVQKVFLLLAETDNKKFKVEQKKNNIEVEDIKESYSLEFVIKGRERIKLGLPLLDYFYSIVNGEISTDINPALSHGIDKINNMLVKQFREENNEDVMSLILVDSQNNIKKINIDLSEDNIIFE